MDVSKCDVLVDSDLKQFGFKEDGIPFIGEVYCVSIQNPQGDRWNHTHIFPGVRVICNDEGYSVFEDIREEAKAKAKHLAAAVEKSKCIDVAHWNAARPVYGSAAYQDYGMHDDIMREKIEG